MNLNPTSNTTSDPEILVGFKKKLNTITITHEKDYEIELDNGKFNLINLDQIITEILMKEMEKEKLRRELSGKL